MFLTLPYSSMEADFAGKRVYFGGCYRLEIPVEYHFLGLSKAIDW